MKNYGIIRSAAKPKSIDVTPASVFIALDPYEYEEEIDGHLIKGYEYEYIEYTKDEYIAKLAEDNASLQQEVLDTQLALTDLYEMVGEE